jgi:hypothetical protein
MGYDGKRRSITRCTSCKEALQAASEAATPIVKLLQAYVSL